MANDILVDEFKKTGLEVKIDQAKVSMLEQASLEDKEFNRKIANKLKDVASSSVDMEQQIINYKQEIIAKDQELNKYKKRENKWENKMKAREYHYNGLKTILNSVGIKEPMNIFLEYLIATILLPFWLLGKLLRGTIGVLIAGAENTDRGKMARGFMWTILMVLFGLILYIIIVNLLKYNII